MGRRPWRVLVGAAVLVLVAALAGDAGAGPRLEIIDHTEGRLLLTRHVAVGDRLLLEHTHSVTKRPVEEVFSVGGQGGIAMEELRFDTFGANLPAGPERIGDVTTTFVREDGHYRVVHHGRPLGTVQLRVGGPEVGHAVTLPGGERFRLLDIVPRGTFVEIGIRGVPGP